MDGRKDDERDARIAERAYQLWEEDGRPEGLAEEHWMRAERESRDVDADPADAIAFPDEPDHDDPTPTIEEQAATVAPEVSPPAARKGRLRKPK